MVDEHGVVGIEITSFVYLSDITVTGKRLPEDTNNVTEVFRRLFSSDLKNITFSERYKLSGTCRSRQINLVRGS